MSQIIILQRERLQVKFPSAPLRWCPGSADPPSTFAHEILHLFGARDLYLEGAETHRRQDEVHEEIKQRLEKGFEVEDLEDSIMNRFHAGRAHVDAATAFAVSWLDELPRQRPVSGADEIEAEEISDDEAPAEELLERARAEAVRQLLPPT